MAHGFVNGFLRFAAGSSSDGVGAAAKGRGAWWRWPALSRTAANVDGRMPDTRESLQHCQGLLLALVQAHPDCLIVLDLAARIQAVNREGRELLAIADFAQVAGRSWFELWQPSCRREAQACFELTCQDQVCRFQGCCPALDGVEKWWEVQLSPVHDPAGRVMAVLALARDISQEVKRSKLLVDAWDAYQQVVESVERDQARLRVMQEAAECGDWDMDPASGRLRLSASAQRLLGLPPEAQDNAKGALMAALLPEDGNELIGHLVSRIATRQPIDCRFRLRYAETGELRHFHMRGRLVRGPKDQAPQVVGVIHDVSGAHRATLQLAQNEQRLALALSGTNDGLWDWDIGLGQTYYSPRFLELVECPEAIHDNFNVLLDRMVVDDDVFAVRQALERHLNDGRPYDVQFRMRTFNNRMRWFRARGKAGWQDGRALRFAGALMDITENKVLLSVVRDIADRAANYDILTGMPNRERLLQELKERITLADKRGDRFALMLIDLDRFKNINDTLGHPYGDQLLLMAGQRLQSIIRASDLCARLGGDEFAVLFDGLAAAECAAERAQQVIAVLSRPYDFQGQEAILTASVGIAFHPDDGADAESLLKQADVAMYAAKQQGRNNFQFYGRQRQLPTLAQLNLETQLRKALERQQFELHYQPQFALANTQLCGAEALLRWRGPGAELIPPAEFIPLLEETGLILPVGAWVVDTACAQLQRWFREGLGRFRLAINVSAQQLRNDALIDHVEAIIARLALPPECLELELTESALMQEPANAARFLARLRRLGVRVAVDDFGTGYSSLSYLRHFAPDTLKIDKGFIADIDQNPEGRAIVEGIIQLAKSLRIDVVAEGVERASQLEILRACGCDQVQGFLLGRPQTVADMDLLLARDRLVTAPNSPGDLPV